MKRDLELIRRILRAMVSADFVPGTELRIQGERPAAVGYHVYLLQREHFVDALDEGGADSKEPWYVPISLMPAGREFLAATRDDLRWRRFLGDLGPRAWAMTLHELKTALASDAKRGPMG